MNTKLIAMAGVTATLSALSAVPGIAFAQDKAAESPHSFVGNLSLVSEYRYRGIAQTNKKPALQGGVDYTHASGFYAGTWLTNVSWLSDGGGGTVSSSIEWDVYGGFKGSAGDFGYDVGLLYYYYPGSYPSGYNSPNTLEAYVAGSWKMLTLKYSYALTDLFGAIDSKGASYVDLSADFDLGSGFSLVAHVGHQYVPATSGRSRSDCSYNDWKLGVNKDYAGVTWGLAYVDSDAKGGVGECYRSAFNRDLGKGTVVLSVSKTF